MIDKRNMTATVTFFEIYKQIKTAILILLYRILVVRFSYIIIH